MNTFEREFQFHDSWARLIVDVESAKNVLEDDHAPVPAQFELYTNSPEGIKIKPGNKLSLVGTTTREVESSIDASQSLMINHSLKTTGSQSRSTFKITGPSAKENKIRVPPPYALAALDEIADGDITATELQSIIDQYYPQSSYRTRMKRFTNNARNVLPTQKYLELVEVLEKSERFKHPETKVIKSWIDDEVFDYWGGRNIGTDEEIDEIINRTVEISNDQFGRWHLVSYGLVEQATAEDTGLKNLMNVRDLVLGGDWNRHLRIDEIATLIGIYTYHDSFAAAREIASSTSSPLTTNYWSAKANAKESNLAEAGELWARLLPDAAQKGRHEFRYVLCNAAFHLGEKGRHSPCSNVAHVLLETAANLAEELGIQWVRHRGEIRSKYVRGHYLSSGDVVGAEKSFREAVQAARTIQVNDGHADRTLLTAGINGMKYTWIQCAENRMSADSAKERIQQYLRWIVLGREAADDDRIQRALSFAIGSWAGIVAVQHSTDQCQDCEELEWKIPLERFVEISKNQFVAAHFPEEAERLEQELTGSGE